MSLGRYLGLPLPLALCMFSAGVPRTLSAQATDPTTANPPEKHGRKYKAPPETTHIEVQVIKGFNKKPIMNAAVIFHEIKDGQDEGNLEVKTDPDGKAIIDVIPINSNVRVQVIADGFATFAEDYVVKEPSRQILVTMLRPQAQISTYQDNTGQTSQRAPGVQEPIRPKPKSTTAPGTPAPAAAPVAPAPSVPAPAPDSKPNL